MNASNYVIQLDADTVTLSYPKEVVECIEANRSFTLGTLDGKQIISCQEASRIASTWPYTHVQVVAEQALANIPASKGSLYVHGCAGFTGFSPASINRMRVEEVSEAFAELIPASKWQEWGSEQVTSNFLIANLPDAVILPPEDYPFWEPGLETENARLVHFFGTHRFKGGKYTKSARKVIKELRTV
jgi:hypothetical protein